MKPDPKNFSTSRVLLASLALIGASLALPAPALAQTVELATSPMASSTTSVVKPNLMFVLDDSGSMDWDYLPDTAKNFAGKYGYNTAQCNGNYYNPAVTYDPPVNSVGAPLNATPTTFTAAYKDGYATGAGTVNLSTGFTGGSGSGASGISLPAGPAFYYTYSGSQTSNAAKNYFNTSSTFYQECNSSIGSTPGSGVFTKTRLASTPTTTITIVSGGGGGASLTVSGVSGSNRGEVDNLAVNLGPAREIMAFRARTPKGGPNTNAELANRIAAQVNACTSALTGNCQVTGYSATVSGAVVTISGPAAAGTTITASNIFNATIGSYTAFSAGTSSRVDSVTVNGITITSAATALQNTPSALATDLAGRITLASYSATASGNVVTVTGPTSASLFTPVIAISGTAPLMTAVTDAFPESTPAKLQNFANWYSYYSNRMIMMKTGAGLAFKQVTDKYRVGFITMNNNVSPGIIEVAPFVGDTGAVPCAAGSNACQRDKWYNALYAANPANSTPLREVLSRVGQYYAHKFGNVTKYTATITVSGSVATTIDDITVGGVSIMEDTSLSAATSNQVARNIADQINAVQVTDFGASVSGSVITITGPASANGATPVIVGTDPTSGGMSITPAAFTSTTTTAQINGITPADPIQYSCQQNFTLLSTDGYWNGPNTYDLNNNPVGQQDGSAPRPFADGAQAVTTYTNTYVRNTYGRTSGSGTCSSGRPETVTPQTGTCSTTVAGGSCTPSNWVNGTTTTLSPQVCISSGSIPPNSAPVLTGTVSTPGVVGGSSNSLADVSMYYYQTDLRTPALGNCTGVLGTSVCENNVFVSANDNNLQQHMTTFTLGLGVRGRMVYSPSYLTDTTGDFVAVKLGSTSTGAGGVCSWQASGTVCNWPVPSSGSVETTDDLWHAAVNGRGAYFSATDPDSLSTGISNALTSISSKLGSAAAAATSTLNPVAGNNFAYVASYTTQKWTGNLEARGINTDTGVINENASWCLETIAAATCAAPGTLVSDSSGDTTAWFCQIPLQVTCPGGELIGTDCRIPVATACTGTMGTRVTSTTDTRVIKTSSGGTTPTLIDFDVAYATANPSYFNAATLAGLSQWPPASDTSPDAVYFRANAPGVNLLNYLRGQFGHELSRATPQPTPPNESNEFYRNRASVIGDALESQPAFIGAPIFSYPYPGYTEFLAAQASRLGNVYMGTNDGMMHAFDAANGVERWAYVPSMVIPDLWRLADYQYKDNHRNYVNGSPITTDICTANCNNPVTGVPATDPVWKTILVAGLNGGGRGYFALDITNPTTPVLLWEFTTTAGIGKTKDDDLGYSFGQPVITRKTDGTWVVLVTSGYDNGASSPYKSAGSFIANAPAGSGQGYLYVLNATTGAIISKISTGVGTAAVPSGLAKIAGFNVEPGGNRANFVYGGDLLGNLWRFDINAGTAASLGSGNIGNGTAFKFATLFSDAAGTIPQPITTTPILGTVGGKRIIYIGTGKYLEVPDLTTAQVQTQYALKDDDATVTFVNPRASSSMVQQFLVNNPDGTGTRLVAATAGSTTPGANAVDLSIQRGWFIDFPVSRERVNIDAKLVLGTLVVPTIVPSSTECAPGGTGWLNFFDYRTGGAVNPLTGLTSVKYDSTIVGINVLFIEGKPIVEVVTSTDPTPTKDPNVQFAAAAAGFTGKRVLWRELVPQD